MRRAAYTIAAVLFLAFAYDLTRLPVQLHDGLSDIQEVRVDSSAFDSFVRELHHKGYLRPLKAAQIRLVFDASAGHYTFAYRTIHVLLLGLTLWMFVRILRVKTVTDVAAAAFALTVLLGLHTFGNLLREAYPINHFLEILLFSLVVLDLAQGAPRLRNDIVAAVLFVAGSVVIESGLLIWVVIVAARLGGFRGISWRGVALVSSLLIAYIGLRMFVFSNGLPAINERSTGYFFRILEDTELIERFGSDPRPLYLYNVVASFLTVLTSEPRAGQLVLTAQYLAGQLTPWAVVATLSSLATTVLIVVGWGARIRSGATTSDADRFFFVFAVVLAANAVLSFAYTKGDIVSVAGAFYALASYAAIRRLIESGAGAKLLPRVLLCVLVLVASTGWAVRTMGLHYSLRYQAFKVRNDWASVPDRWTATPEARQVTERLRQDALSRRVVAPRFYPRWEEQWFEE